MFALYFLGKPSSIYDKDNPDWAPSLKLGYDCNKVTESSQERYNRAKERVVKRRRTEGAIALIELSKATMDTGVTVDELNCKACQTDITTEYFTELIENEEKLRKENAALKDQLKQNSLSQDRHLYLSLSVRVDLITSGTQLTPHLLNLPSPIDRETSNTPRTRPSLLTSQ